MNSGWTVIVPNRKFECTSVTLTNQRVRTHNVPLRRHATQCSCPHLRLGLAGDAYGASQGCNCTVVINNIISSGASDKTHGLFYEMVRQQRGHHCFYWGGLTWWLQCVYHITLTVSYSFRNGIAFKKETLSVHFSFAKKCLLRLLTFNES